MPCYVLDRATVRCAEPGSTLSFPTAAIPLALLLMQEITLGPFSYSQHPQCTNMTTDDVLVDSASPHVMTSAMSLPGARQSITTYTRSEG